MFFCPLFLHPFYYSIADFTVKGLYRAEVNICNIKTEMLFILRKKSSMRR